MVMWPPSCVGHWPRIATKDFMPVTLETISVSSPLSLLDHSMAFSSLCLTASWEAGDAGVNFYPHFPVVGIEAQGGHGAYPRPHS